MELLTKKKKSPVTEGSRIFKNSVSFYIYKDINYKSLRISISRLTHSSSAHGRKETNIDFTGDVSFQESQIPFLKM
jgi:hypothetical protein